jgi:hypothetical protein
MDSKRSDADSEINLLDQIHDINQLADITMFDAIQKFKMKPIQLTQF